MRHLSIPLQKNTNLSVAAIFMAALTALSLVITSINMPAASAEDCVPAPHTAVAQTSSLPAQQTATAGSTVYFHLDITNNDTGCGSSEFTVANASLPAGWSFAPNAGSQQVDSQETTGYTVWYTSPTTAANGDYDLTVNISRSEESTVTPVDFRYTVTGQSTPAPDTTGPSLSILSPVAGTTVKKGSTVAINVNASDASGIKHINYYVDGFVVCINYGASCPWTTPNRRATFQIEVRAEDNAGNVTSAFTSVKTQ
jgi:hypothetical protein